MVRSSVKSRNSSDRYLSSLQLAYVLSKRQDGGNVSIHTRNKAEARDSRIESVFYYDYVHTGGQ